MVKKDIFKNLFIFEMANNHMGDVEHGLRIISQLKGLTRGFDFNFGFKLQYRHLDTFIHPAYKDKSDFRYVKRFQESRLTEADFKLLKAKIEESGFISICTPFDENSVGLIEKHDFDIIKIASCSFTDWTLLERVIHNDKPIIASTAGASLEDIDRVVSFFEHRNKQFALMHCIGEYPADDLSLELNQIGLLSNRYAGVPIGYSAHEKPDNFDAVKIAVAKGATIFERHVGIGTDKYKLNAYSLSPELACQWLKSAQDAMRICGDSSAKRITTEKEILSIRGLKRGVFARRDIKEGEKISLSNTFLAIPNLTGQVLAQDLSKYTEFIADRCIKKDSPVLFAGVVVKNLRGKIVKIMNAIVPILVAGKIKLSNKLELELSHHYGIDNFEKWGAAIITCVNREYCKKLIILLPGQGHPVHYHINKEETFHVVYGGVNINLDGSDEKYSAGDMVIVERRAKHGFSSIKGAILEEISTTHYNDDSFYDDEQINKNGERKTRLTFWADWLYRPISQRG